MGKGLNLHQGFAHDLRPELLLQCLVYVNEELAFAGVPERLDDGRGLGDCAEERARCADQFLITVNGGSEGLPIQSPFSALGAPLHDEPPRDGWPPGSSPRRRA
jgi:hypothetical protein